MAGFHFSSFASANPARLQQAVTAVADLLSSKKVVSPKGKYFPQADFLAAMKAVEEGGAAVLKL